MRIILGLLCNSHLRIASSYPSMLANLKQAAGWATAAPLDLCVTRRAGTAFSDAQMGSVWPDQKTTHMPISGVKRQKYWVNT